MTLIAPGANLNLGQVFDFTAVPLIWRNQSPMQTFFNNAFSCIIPVYEAFLLNALIEAKAIINPEYLDTLNAFIDEESTHTEAHVQFNQALQNKGVDVDRYETLAKTSMEKFAKLPLASRLELMAFMEAMSSAISSQFLRHVQSEDIFLPAKELFVWHAIEELEHRDVAYRLYQASRRRKLNRQLIVSFYFSTAILLTKIIGLQLFKHKCFFQLKTFKGLFWFFNLKGPVFATLRGLFHFGRKNYSPETFFTSPEQEYFINHWKKSY